jgi:hypothetical protein
MKKLEASQGSWVRAPNSTVIFGRAVAMMSWSGQRGRRGGLPRAKRKTETMRERNTTMKRQRLMGTGAWMPEAGPAGGVGLLATLRTLGVAEPLGSLARASSERRDAGREGILVGGLEDEASVASLLLCCDWSRGVGMLEGCGCWCCVVMLSAR